MATFWKMLPRPPPNYSTSVLPLADRISGCKRFNLSPVTDWKMSSAHDSAGNTFPFQAIVSPPPFPPPNGFFFLESAMLPAGVPREGITPQVFFERDKPGAGAELPFGWPFSLKRLSPLPPFCPPLFGDRLLMLTFSLESEFFRSIRRN